MNKNNEIKIGDFGISKELNSYKKFLPIALNYRLLNNNKIFEFIYRIRLYRKM